MDEVWKRKLKALGLLTTYGAALYHAGSNLEKASQVNDHFDAKAAMFVAASGSTATTASYINLTPYTVVDNQYFNVDAAHAATKDLKIQIGHPGIDDDQG